MSKIPVNIVDSFSVNHISSVVAGVETEVAGPVLSFDRAVSDSARITIETAAIQGSRGIALKKAGDDDLSAASDILYRMTCTSPTLPRPINAKTGKYCSQVLVWEYLTGKEDSSACSRAFKAGTLRNGETPIACGSVEAASTLQRAISGATQDGTTVKVAEEKAKVAFMAARSDGQSEAKAAAAAAAIVNPPAGVKALKRTHRAPTSVSVASIVDAMADPDMVNGIAAAAAARMGKGAWAVLRSAINKAINEAAKQAAKA